MSANFQQINPAREGLDGVEHCAVSFGKQYPDTKECTRFACPETDVKKHGGIVDGRDSSFDLRPGPRHQRRAAIKTVGAPGFCAIVDTQAAFGGGGDLRGEPIARH